ncbi:MAG: DUF3343 domain-containing protein [Clostridium sp.]|uniref:DUF3343 domain-containing protein n=1 Tax=Clostridium sp. TaxID=1506 RepID=UPI002A8EC5D8|nr:DUF3343 domain-containing protein [Clostridium sp.]MDY5097728.1 DUF3343 domain-containing protein [Clostridium sp.]
MEYIATFFTHSGAISFSRFLTKNLIENEKMPIPRKLSSNCGIGVSFNYDGDLEEIHSDDMEKIFSSSKGEYKLLKEF